MYEARSKRPLAHAEFRRRVVGHVGFALVGVGLALAIGVFGYHFVAGLPWIDSLLNASMILAGMGPVDPMGTDAAKGFASAYALFSGLVFIGVAGILVAPFAHRLLHRFHWDEMEGSEESS